MAFGKYAADFEERINYDRLRAERLQKAKDQINKDGLGAVVTFDADSIRYITAHYITTPLRPAQMQFVVLPKNGDPVLFFASNVDRLRERMPWLKGKIRPAEGIRRERRRRNHKVGKHRETATYRTNEAAKLLNLYKSKPSPSNNSNREGSGGQVLTIDNY